MTLRQLVNVAYVALIEGLEPEERRELDRALAGAAAAEAEPDPRVQRESQQQLMAMLAMRTEGAA
jgi:hypothetical protein